MKKLWFFCLMMFLAIVKHDVYAVTMTPVPMDIPCTPRLACMDLNPPCQPDLGPNAPPICPKRPVTTIAPTLTPVPICGWCGTSCTKITSEMICAAVIPPRDKVCQQIGNTCTVVGITSPPSVSPSRMPTLTLTPIPTTFTGSTLPPTNLKATCSADGKQATLTWDSMSGATKYNLGINDISNDGGSGCTGAGKWFCPNSYDKSISNVTKASYVIDVPANKKVDWAVNATYGTKTSPVAKGSVTCNTCTPRLACMDLNPPCQPDLGPNAPPICPKTPTISVTPILTGNILLGDANKDGKVDLVDFSIWKKEYLDEVGTKTADFNKDLKVDLVDFSIWKKAYLD